MSSGMGGVGALKEPEISKEFNRLEEAIVNLEKTCCDLEARLQPIISTKAEKTCAENQLPTQILCFLADRIRGFRDRIEIVKSQVRIIITTIEL